MNRRTLIVILIAASLGCEGCASKSGVRSSSDIISELLAQQCENVGVFLHLDEGEHVWVDVSQEDGDGHVVILSHDLEHAVLIEFGWNIDQHKREILNVGFGDRDPDGQWRLSHQPRNGRLFESHGGIGTLQEISAKMEASRHEPRLGSLSWAKCR